MPYILLKHFYSTYINNWWHVMNPCFINDGEYTRVLISLLEHTKV